MFKRCTHDWLRWAAELATLLLAVALSGSIPLARADPPVDGSIDVVIAELVGEALAANAELEAAGATVAERRAALVAARARYLPALDFSARYSRADGGRVIDIPVGDLLNPVYTTLNELTGRSRFPPVANQQINFLRSREQDTKLSLTQPLYDGRIAAARDAAGAGYDASTATRAALAGRIERDVRQAYYRWLESRERVGILDATLELSVENDRVNDSLFRNGKVTRDLVYRAEADVLEVRQARLAAGNGERLAQSYVNLLRNAPFDARLPVAGAVDPDIEGLNAALARRAGAAVLTEDALEAVALERRAELRQVDATVAAAAAGERLARAAFKPQLAFALDAGTQGEGYGLAADDRYVFASLVLKFNLFAGGADEAGLAGAHAARREARANRVALELRIRLEVQQALLALELAEASLGTATKRIAAASGAFRIAARKRDLGQINQSEFLDARRALTDAELNLNVTRFEALDSLAELEYALGTGASRAAKDATP
jgi:outer membrane protein